MTFQAQWAEASAAVEAAQKILIVTHVNPDGDAIGSMLALALALREQGKQVTTAVDGGVPDFLGYLKDSGKVIGRLKRGHFDLMVSVDASDEERTGIAGAFGRRRSQRVINLDHHPTNTGFGDIHLVLPEAVSATEVVYEWLSRMGHPLSQPIATALLTGLVTDTMGFRTSNVTATTLGIAQQLMQAGASLTEVTARALVARSYSTIELWKRVLPLVRLEDRIISGVVAQADLAAVGLVDVTDGGLVSLLASVQEAVIAVVFKETREHRVEISLRSKPGYDVGTVALSLGGGGHTQAAGATIDGPLEAAIARVMPLLRVAAGVGAAA
ncbi:MAG: bifunctional oligoribonuclease/PAP phosphatase NrnA [Chloroflexi bacterium]|nr:bifunctional oligoribonuclease/PAP phosphatase NrnA [Chloroflexota bacterium]